MGGWPHGKRGQDRAADGSKFHHNVITPAERGRHADEALAAGVPIMPKSHNTLHGFLCGRRRGCCHISQALIGTGAACLCQDKHVMILVIIIIVGTLQS